MSKLSYTQSDLLADRQDGLIAVLNVCTKASRVKEAGAVRRNLDIVFITLLRDTQRERTMLLCAKPRCSRLHGPTPDSPPATPAELTSALYDAGTLQHGAIINVT